jgi:26S proteasome regulatory subunit N2
MITDKDHIIRYGGMFAIALAYVGTASNSAIQKLLHVAVSDVSDDVRRAAVSALGFVLLRSPEQVCWSRACFTSRALVLNWRLSGFTR